MPGAFVQHGEGVRALEGLVEIATGYDIVAIAVFGGDDLHQLLGLGALALAVVVLSLIHI